MIALARVICPGIPNRLLILRFLLQLVPKFTAPCYNLQRFLELMADDESECVQLHDHGERPHEVEDDLRAGGGCPHRFAGARVPPDFDRGAVRRRQRTTDRQTTEPTLAHGQPEQPSGWGENSHDLNFLGTHRRQNPMMNTCSTHAPASISSTKSDRRQTLRSSWLRAVASMALNSSHPLPCQTAAAERQQKSVHVFAYVPGRRRRGAFESIGEGSSAVFASAAAAGAPASGNSRVTGVVLSGSLERRYTSEMKAMLDKKKHAKAATLSQQLVAHWRLPAASSLCCQNARPDAKNACTSAEMKAKRKTKNVNLMKSASCRTPRRNR